MSAPPPPPPALLPPPKPATQKRKPKKWVVSEPDTKLRPFRVPDDCKAVPVDEASMLKRWTSKNAIVGVQKSSAGSSGVILVRWTGGGTVVIKSTSTLGQELFGTCVAQACGAPTPAARIVSWQDAEWSALKRALALACGEDPQVAYGMGTVPGKSTIWRRIYRTLDRPIYSINQFIPGVPLSALRGSLATLGESPPPDAVVILRESAFEALGALAALDVAINNADRTPTLWDNPGNAGNILVVDNGRSIVGVDNRAVSIDSGKNREAYIARVAATLAEVHARAAHAPVFSRLLAWIEGFRHPKSKPADAKTRQVYLAAMHKGFVRVITRASACLDLNGSRGLKSKVVKSCRSDWQGVWAGMAQTIDPEFFAAVAKACCAKSASSV